MGFVVEFRIYIPPSSQECDSTPLYVDTQCLNLKARLAVKDIVVSRCEILTVHEYQNNLNVTGHLISFEAVCHKAPNIKKAYDFLRSIWNEITAGYNKDLVPLLILNGRYAFPQFHATQHRNVSCRSVSFGVLPYPGSFVSYASLLHGINSVDFDHGGRIIEIDFSCNSKHMKFSLCYKFIRRICVCYGPGVVKLFFDLLHPPILYEQCRKNRFVNNHRILSTQHVRLDHTVIAKSNVLLLELLETEESVEVISRLHYRCNLIDVHYGNITTTVSSPPYVSIEFPYFSCNYLLAAMMNRSYFVAEQCRNISYLLNRDHFMNLKEKPLEKALVDLLFTLDYGMFFHFYHGLLFLYQCYCSHDENDSFSRYIIPERSRLIRRVVITPTRYLLYPPEIMFENRILRNFDPEFALRVSFRDDNMSRLSFMSYYTEEVIFTSAIKKPMLQGLTFGDRHYEFLAWSNSQIRDHGVWMYARDTKGFTAAEIRRWMGNFSKIRTVSKYMSRMGQCFSQTVETISVPLEENHVIIEKDIEGGFDYDAMKPFCFSDGIGKISASLAKTVRNILEDHKYCSAFQIRYSGSKGMLVVDPTLTHTDIVFRESMVKFSSDSNRKLEIAKVSSPTPLQLNRPFITLLDGLGIKAPIFLQMQENMLSTLTEMLFVEGKAVEYLKLKCSMNSFKFKELSASGIGLTVEPFFRAMLLALHRHHVEMIKTKANIAIDPKDGRNMFGVLDETGHLQYGQVFVQYTNDISFGKTTQDTSIVKGTVVVTKNPCMHPGDVRKFTAVDVPSLHHIIDCIVFPRNGPRPHPNELSGSDLDGDEYAVLWKKEMIFSTDNFPAASYPAHSAQEKYSISVEDMIDFLVDYIKHDQVGVIANAHLAVADEISIFCAKSLAIAKKFSIAVDFAKNGTKAELQACDRPTTFPDFMEKSYKKTYKSKKVLGKLFRVCKDFEVANQTSRTSGYGHVQMDPSLVYPGWEKFESEAIKSRDKYNWLLYIVFQTYGVIHEAEAFSGAFSQFHYRFQERKDKDEVEKIVIGSLKALCKNMKEEFMSEFEESDMLCEKMLQKASAWYVVTYRERNAEFLSFPWIVSNFLANIKLKTLAMPVHPSYCPLVTDLDKIIRKCLNENRLHPLSNQIQLKISNYKLFCTSDVISESLRVMVLWAMDMLVIQDPEYGRQRGFMFLEKFVDLFLYVASVENYLSFNSEATVQVKDNHHQKSPATLCLAFLRFCMKLRFCNKAQAKELVPFPVFKYKWLATRATITYHSLAITGRFNSLSFDSSIHEDIIEMKPEFIDITAISITGMLSEELLLRASRHLKELSGVEHVSMTEICSTRQIRVHAFGTEESLHILKNIIRKNTYLLN